MPSSLKIDTSACRRPVYLDVAAIGSTCTCRGLCAWWGMALQPIYFAFDKQLRNLY